MSAESSHPQFPMEWNIGGHDGKPVNSRSRHQQRASPPPAMLHADARQQASRLHPVSVGIRPEMNESKAELTETAVFPEPRSTPTENCTDILPLELKYQERLPAEQPNTLHKSNPSWRTAAAHEGRPILGAPAQQVSLGGALQRERQLHFGQGAVSSQETLNISTEHLSIPASLAKGLPAPPNQETTKTISFTLACVQVPETL